MTGKESHSTTVWEVCGFRGGLPPSCIWWSFLALSEALLCLEFKLTGDKGRTAISLLDPWGSREEKGELIKTLELVSWFSRVLAHSGSHLRLTSLRPAQQPYFESTNTWLTSGQVATKASMNISSASSSVVPLNLRLQRGPVKHWTTLTCCFLGIAQVLAARHLSFIHVNALGSHTEGLLNLVAQTITKEIPWAFLNDGAVTLLGTPCCLIHGVCWNWGTSHIHRVCCIQAVLSV